MRLGEQVAARATGRISKVLFPIRVAAQANIAARAFDRTVAGVAAATRRMLRFLVQTAQLGT